MSDSVDKKPAAAWKWILAGGAGGLLLVALTVWGLVSLAVAKGKPQIAEALQRVVENEKDRLDPGQMGLLRQMSARASEKQTSLAAVWMISQGISGALADGKISEAELRLLQNINVFVGNAGGRVGFRDASAFMTADPEIKKLLDEDALSGRVVSMTTSTQAGK